MKPSIPFYRVESISRPNTRVPEPWEVEEQEEADDFLQARNKELIAERFVEAVIVLMLVCGVGYMCWAMS